MVFYAKKLNGEIVYQLDKTYKSFIESLKEGDKLEIEIKPFIKKRSDQQNRALHLWFTQLAKALNDEGFDMRTVISEGIDIPWSSYTIKEHLWRPTQKTLFGIKSTKNLKRGKEIDTIYDVINKTIGERTGIYVPFPSMETLIDN